MGIRDSGFDLTESNKKPIIMIGAGAGIAPFIGFLEQNLYLF